MHASHSIKPPGLNPILFQRLLKTAATEAGSAVRESTIFHSAKTKMREESSAKTEK
jgi:hypothetical protein